MARATLGRQNRDFENGEQILCSSSSLERVDFSQNIFVNSKCVI